MVEQCSTSLAIDLFCRGLRDMPGFGCHKLLENLDLSKCDFASLPAAFTTSLPALVNLTLQGNRLSSLPEHFNLPLLEMLNVTGNRLTTLPPSLGTSCPKLRVLFFNDNDMASLPVALVKSYTTKTNHDDTTHMIFLYGWL